MKDEKWYCEVQAPPELHEHIEQLFNAISYKIRHADGWIEGYKYGLEICRRYWHPTFNPIMEEVEKLPSAQSQRKTGKWIDLKCNQCGQVDMSKPNFCPACGADMRTEGNDELSEGMQPKWIPCSERLPERGTSILMASRQGWVAEGEYKGVLDGRHLWIEYRWSASLTNGEIIAWMPLPKPYGGESDER